MALTQTQISQVWGWWPTGDCGPLTFYTSHKRHVTVAYPRAPPKEPPSWKQKIEQTRFRSAARLWSLQPNSTRDAWTLACKRAQLSISGFNFWMYVHLRHDEPAARTVQRQSGVNLGY